MHVSVIFTGDIATLKDEFKQLNSELLVLRSLLAGKGYSGPNGILLQPTRGVLNSSVTLSCLLRGS